MNCEQIAALMPDYLENALGRDQERLVEQHIESCAECRQLAALGRNLALLPQEEPSPALRERFQGVLASFDDGRLEQLAFAPEPVRRGAWAMGWFRSPLAAVGATAALLVLGFLGGRYSTTQTNAQAQQQVASMENELTSMRQLMVLSMLQEESASERLQGVSWSTRQQQADPQILAALLRTLRYDSSVDVRLAALDALGRYGNHPQVRQGLAEALASQQSPLVQVQLIDTLVQLRDRSVVDELRKIQQNSDVDPAVRERAERAISQLS
ncbi:MAG TPA: HEAT repeat domain-containing protein [Verrucomicrobiae bacterium]|nr:HEAT repeat domain-containing protein [Verrucomicrobiae bacterium]